MIWKVMLLNTHFLNSMVTESVKDGNDYAVIKYKLEDVDVKDENGADGFGP